MPQFAVISVAQSFRQALLCTSLLTWHYEHEALKKGDAIVYRS